MNILERTKQYFRFARKIDQTNSGDIYISRTFYRNEFYRYKNFLRLCDMVYNQSERLKDVPFVQLWLDALLVSDIYIHSVQIIKTKLFSYHVLYQYKAVLL